MTEVGVTGQIVWYPVPSTPAPQLFDTHIDGTTSPEHPTWSFYYEGVRTLHFRATIYTTACNIGPSELTHDRSYRIVRCIPRFTTTSQDQVVHLTNAGTSPIYVYIPPGMNTSNTQT